MTYNKKVWEDRQVQHPMTFTMQDNSDGTTTLIPTEGTVIKSGTPINALNMNHIEQGIKDTEDYASLLNGNQGFYKQALINGNFDIWQRGVSQTTHSYGSDDRWFNGNSGSTKTHSRQSFGIGQTDVPNNPRYFSRTVVTSVAGAGSYVNKVQKIEDVTLFSDKTATLTFWAKANASKQIAISFVQDFGIGGSDPIYDIAPTKFSLTTSWQKFSMTVNFPSVSGKTLGSDHCTHLRIWFDAGANFNIATNSMGQQSGTFDIAQVQLNEGETELPFSPRFYDDELRLCQRYYEKSYDINSYAGSTSVQVGYDTFFGLSGNYLTGKASFKVRKRVSPTVSIYSVIQGTLNQVNDAGDGTTYNISSVTVGGETGFCFITGSGFVDKNPYRFQWTADAEL